MKTKIFLLALLVAIAGCASKKGGASGASSDDYGYTESNPIKVGGGSEGPAMERKFLDRLTGPNGEPITYKRAGSCCPFETPNSAWGGMLDIYEVTIAGDETPKTLYLNMYDKDGLYAPKGFTFKQ